LKKKKKRSLILQFIENKFRKIFSEYCFDGPSVIFDAAQAAQASNTTGLPIVEEEEDENNVAINHDSKVFVNTNGTHYGFGVGDDDEEFGFGGNDTDEETYGFSGGGNHTLFQKILDYKQNINEKTLSELTNKVLLRTAGHTGDIEKYPFSTSSIDPKKTSIQQLTKHRNSFTRIYPSLNANCVDFGEVRKVATRPGRKDSTELVTSMAVPSASLGVRDDLPGPQSERCKNFNTKIYENFINLDEKSAEYSTNERTKFEEKRWFNINCVAVNIHDLEEATFQELKNLFENKFREVSIELFGGEVGASGGGRIKKKTKRRRVLNRNRTIKRNQLIKKGGSIKKRKLLKSKKRRKRLTKKRK
jgi:hypothetical protein